MKVLPPLALVVVATLAHGQMVECKPPPTCDAGVLFQPSPADLQEAQSVWLDPVSPPNPVLLQLKPIGRHALSGSIEIAGLSDLDGIEIEARFVLHGKGGDELSAWTPLTSTPTSFVEDLASRADVDIEYRARVQGSAPAGEHIASVVFHAWDGGTGPDHKDTAAHPLRVIVPAYLALRLAGLPTATEAWVTFDFSGVNALAFAGAIDTGTPVRPTGATFDAVEIATNAPHGYDVALHVTPVVGPSGQLDPTRLLARGVPVDGEVLGGSGPTDGFEPIILVQDLALLVDGTMAPGSYAYTVQFDAAARP